MPDIEEQTNANQEDFDGGADKLWSVYNKEAEVHDKVFMESLKSETDSIIIFAGLFSAVLTAFLVEASKRLKPGPAEQTNALLSQTVALLSQISQQLGPNGSQVAISPPASLEASFQVTSSELRVNTFWFMSLGFSLTAALAATLIQQWIRDYMQAPKRPIGCLERARIRGFLSHGWTSSHSIQLLFGCISAFIHISLFLFFIGLADNLFTINHAVAITTSIIIGFCAVFYIACSTIPIFYTKTLYHTPLSKVFWGLAQMTHLRKYSNNTTGGRAVPVSANMDIGRFQIAMSHTADRMARDTEAIRWVLANITEDGEFEPFIAGIRGSFSTLWGARVWENIFKEDDAQPWALSALQLLKIRIESLLKSCADSPFFLDKQTRFSRACMCIDAVASLKLSLGGGSRFNIDGNLMMQVLMYFSREKKRRWTLERAQEARTLPSLTLNSAPRFEDRVMGTLLEIQWKCLVLIAIKKMLRDTNSAWYAHAVWNANTVQKTNAVRDAQAVADAEKAGDANAVRDANTARIANAIRDMETVRDAIAAWDASAAKDTNAPWDANPVWDIDVASAVRQVLDQLRIRRPIEPKGQDGLKCQDFTTPNEVKFWLDNKLNLNTERQQELTARKVDKEMFKAWSAAKQLRSQRRTGPNPAQNDHISEDSLIRTIQKSLNALLHKAQLADHTDLKIIDLVNTLMQKTGGILEDLVGTSFEWPSDVTRPGRNPIFSEIHGKGKSKAHLWRPYCVSAVLDNKWILPHLLPPRMLISNLLVYANPHLGSATDPLTRSIKLDSPDLGAGVLDWSELDQLMTGAGGSRPRPFERQLWRLRDLRDGGTGFIIELFFATFRFLKPVSLTPESAWLLEATLQAITEDGQSESLKRPACQRCLMALREDLEEVLAKKNEGSNSESTRTTSEFILSLLQQLTDEVVKTDEPWYALSKERKKNEEQEEEQEEEEEEEQEEQELEELEEGSLTTQCVYFNRE